MRADVIHGDCLDVMRTMPAASVDAVITDPPYGLSFMGKLWDHGVPGEQFWAEALRVAKPGAALLAFGGTRTFHRLACAIEDGGWEIRDCLAWLYGSGFPKSLDVSKAIDKAAGAERPVVGIELKADKRGGNFHGASERRPPLEWARTSAASAASAAWAGWGTALKPAYEPVILARKPFKGTVAANVLRYRTGALNVEGCRLQTSGPTATIGEWEQDGNLCASCASDAGKRVRPSTPGIGGSTAPRSAAPTRNAAEQTARDGIDRTATGCSAGRSPEAQSGSLAGPSNSSTARSGRTPSDLFPMDSSSTMRTATGSTTVPRTCASCGEPTTSPSTLLGTPTGRWPSNVLLDEEAARAVDEISGESRSAASGYDWSPSGNDNPAHVTRNIRSGIHFGDSGGASRFFFVSHDKGGTIGACNCGSANSASAPSSPSRKPADSAPSPVQCALDLGAEGTPYPSTSGKPSGSSESGESDTPPTLSIEGASSRESTRPSTADLASPVPAAEPDEQTDTTTTTACPWCSSGSAGRVTSDGTLKSRVHGGADFGGNSRVFYTAKASRWDREDGLEGMPKRFLATMGDGIGVREHNPEQPSAHVRNVHPTVKPTDLMRWLCRLVTPPGGTVLDPFCGSGSTGVAANAEGFDFVGIERETEYVEIARRRIANVAPLFAEGGAA